NLTSLPRRIVFVGWDAIGEYRDSVTEFWNVAKPRASGLVWPEVLTLWIEDQHSDRPTRVSKADLGLALVQLSDQQRHEGRLAVASAGEDERALAYQAADVKMDRYLIR